MADETTNPGFLATLAGALKPKDNSPIPQKWLDEMLSLNKTLDTRLQAIANYAKQEFDRNTVKISVLDSLSDSVKLSFKESIVEAFKAYDKELKNSEATKEEERKYKERNESEKKDAQDRDKQLIGGIGKEFSAATSKATPEVELPLSGVVPGESAAEKAIEEIDVQPVSLEQIQPTALKSLQDMFVSVLSGLKLDNKGTKEAAETVKGGELPATGGGGGGFLNNLATGLQKLGTKEALMGAGTLIALGLALVVAAKGLQEFSKVDFASIGKGFLTLLGLVAITKLIASSTVQMLIGAAAIIALGAALYVAAQGFEAFGAVEWESIGKGAVALLALGALGAVFGALIKVIVPGAIAIAALGLAFIPFGFGLQTIAKGLQAFATVEWSSVLKGFAALAGFGVIASVLSFAIVPMLGFGIALLPFSLGIFLLAKALTAFAAVSWDMIKNGMLALGGLGATALLLTPAAVSMALFGVALLPFSLGIFLLAKALTAFAAVSWDMIKTGMQALGGLGLVAGILMPAAVAMGLFGVALLPFSLGIFLLAKALTAFADVSWEMIKTGMQALGGLGIVAGVLMPAAVAMGLFGIALLPFSLGIFLLAKALTAFADVSWEMIATGMKAIAGLGAVTALLTPAAISMGLFGIAMLPFSISLLLLSKALQSFANVTWDMIATGMKAIAGLGAVTLLLTPAAISMALFGIAILPFSISMLMLAKALQAFANVTWDMIQTGMDAIAGLGSTALQLFPAAIALAAFGIALAPFSLSLMLLAKALKMFGEVNFSMIDTAVAALQKFGVVGGLLGFLAPLLALFGIALVPFGLGLMVLTKGLTSFLSVDFSKMQTALLALAAFGAVGGILGLLAIPLALFGLALIPFSFGLKNLSEGLTSFLSVDFSKMQTGLLALAAFGVVGGILGLLAIPLALFGLALIPFSIGLNNLTESLTSFLALDFSKMLPALVTLAAFGVVGGLLGLLAVPLALFGLALIPFGAGLSFLTIGLTSFASLDWNNIKQALLGLFLFGVVGSILGVASPFLIMGAAALGVFGEVLPSFAEGLMAVTEPFNAFVSQLERLADISAVDIGALALSIVGLGTAIAGFGAGSAAAGIGNFVGGLFSSLSGQKSPIEQLISIGEQASNIDKVVSSIGTLKESLAGLGEIKTNLDPLKQFVDVINSVSLAKAAAIATALAVSAPSAALAATALRPTITTQTVAAEETSASTKEQLNVEENVKQEKISPGGEPLRVQTDQGLAVPVAVVPTKITNPATEELNKLNQNIQNVATTPVSEPPMMQMYSNNLKEIGDKLEDLIASIRPLIDRPAGEEGIMMANENSTIVASAPSIANISSDLNRDIPYIERNKYRQTAMYARGLL